MRRDRTNRVATRAGPEARRCHRSTVLKATLPGAPRLAAPAAAR